MSPEIAFLVSVKDTGQYLPELLPSLDNCHVPHQVIVRANGEDQIKETLQHTRWHDVVSYIKPTLTLSQSLNQMLWNVAAPYVMRIDPDDILPAGILPKMMSAITSKYDIVYGHYQDFGEAERLIECKFADAKTLWETSCGPYNFIISTWLAKKVKWAEVGYEDRNMYIRLLAAGGIPKPMDFVTLHHRVRAGGRSDEFAADHDERVAAMRRENLEWFRSQGCLQ